MENLVGSSFLYFIKRPFSERSSIRGRRSQEILQLATHGIDDASLPPHGGAQTRNIESHKSNQSYRYDCP